MLRNFLKKDVWGIRDPLYINVGVLQHVFVATCHHKDDS